MTRRLTIHTSHIKPPIPRRDHDWSAITDDYEPGGPIGFGPTEADAIYDLFLEIEAREEGDQQRYEYEMGGKP